MPRDRPPDMTCMPSMDVPAARPTARPMTLAQQHSDFTAEGAPAPRRGQDAAAPAMDVTSAPEPVAGIPDSLVAIDDWVLLFDAVKTRLKHAVGEAFTGQYNGAAPPLRVTVLECVDALDRLQAMRLDERTGPASSEASEARPRAANGR
jgi:hypothetical protein